MLINLHFLSSVLWNRKYHRYLGNALRHRLGRFRDCHYFQKNLWLSNNFLPEQTEELTRLWHHNNDIGYSDHHVLPIDVDVYGSIRFSFEICQWNRMWMSFNKYQKLLNNWICEYDFSVPSSLSISTFIRDIRHTTWA